LAVNLRQYVSDNRIPAAIVTLAVAAALSWLLRQWVEPGAAENDFVGPPRSDYIVFNGKVWSYDVDGLPSFNMISPRMERRAGDETLYIDSPKFDINAKQPGVPDWQGNSPYGRVNKNGTLINLDGAVYMFRPAYADGPMATLHTSNVTGWPKENRMETAAPATMTQGDSVMNGVGMRANLNDNHMELLNDVHGILYPRQRNATAQRGSHGPAGPAASHGKDG
jgi:lipopolysaccharide export system protein LptC